MMIVMLSLMRVVVMRWIYLYVYSGVAVDNDVVLLVVMMILAVLLMRLLLLILMRV